MNRISMVPIDASLFDDEMFLSWLSETGSEWFRDYLTPNVKARQKYFRSRFINLILRSDAKVLLYQLEGRPVALMGLEKLSWDSKHFGFGCGRLSPFCVETDIDESTHQTLLNACMDQALAWASSNDIKLFQRRLLSLKIDEIRCLEKQGFYLADNVVTLFRNCHDRNNRNEKSKEFIIRVARYEDLEAVLFIMQGAFRYSRFLQDPVFKMCQGESVYTEWIKNIFLKKKKCFIEEKKSDVKVFIAEANENIIGCITYRIDRKDHTLLEYCIGEIELFSVHQEYRRMGIGLALINEVLLGCAKQGVDFLEATTWINSRGPLGLYQKAGFEVVENIMTFHKLI